VSTENSSQPNQHRVERISTAAVKLRAVEARQVNDRLELVLREDHVADLMVKHSLAE
jgi:hypothetical protein